jgi:hypothetical protein
VSKPEVVLRGWAAWAFAIGFPLIAVAIGLHSSWLGAMLWFLLMLLALGPKPSLDREGDQ